MKDVYGCRFIDNRLLCIKLRQSTHPTEKQKEGLEMLEELKKLQQKGKASIQPAQPVYIHPLYFCRGSAGTNDCHLLWSDGL